MTARPASDKLLHALDGISGIHVTPFTADGAVDYGRLAAIVQDMAKAGIQAIVTGGNTGEYFSLTPDEAKSVRHAAAEANGGKAAFLVGVGRSLPEAIDAARDAGRLGADGVLVHQPSDPIASPAGVLDYLRRLSAASPLPVVAYVRSAALDVRHLEQLAAIPNLAGVKYAVADVLKFGEAVRATRGSGVKWVCGLAELWAPPFYAVGGRGFTSGLVNVFPEISLRFWRSLEAGQAEETQDLAEIMRPFEAMRAEQSGGTNVTVIKAALELLGQSTGDVRPPGTVRLSEADLARLSPVVARLRDAQKAKPRDLAATLV